QLPRARAAREGARLLGERALQLGQHLRVVRQLLLVEEAFLLLFLLADQIPRRDEDFLLAARNLVLLAATAAAAATAAGLARLREAAVEGLYLDEVKVGLRRPFPILRNHVVRDQVAGLEARLGRGRLGGLVRVAARR